MKRFARMVAALAVGVGIVTGANRLPGTVTASAGTFGTIQGASGNEAESAADIIEEMKNGDRSRTKKLAEAYRYGRGVEKSMLNAMICYQIAEVDFDSEAKKSYEEIPYTRGDAQRTVLATLGRLKGYPLGNAQIFTLREMICVYIFGKTGI